MTIKKIALLSAVTLMNPCFASFEKTWTHVCPVTNSLVESPQGDFSNCKVAVVDNGFDTRHPELAPALDTQGINGRDGGNNVLTSIVKNKRHREFGKPASHGSHVAGILRQMVPHIPIVPCKRGASGHRNSRSDALCLQALLDRDDVKVVNLSFGINWFHMLEPICQLAKQGKIIVISAGNEGQLVEDLFITERRQLSFFLNNPDIQKRVIFVGATEKINGIERLAYFSNCPMATLSRFFIAAPGTDIESFVPHEISRTGRRESSGTSMAAPVFAASLLRLVTEFNISVDEARQVLFDTSVKRDTPHHFVADTGSGIMDFEKARTFLKNKRDAALNPVVDHVQPQTEPAAVQTNELTIADVHTYFRDKGGVQTGVTDIPQGGQLEQLEPASYPGDQRADDQPVVAEPIRLPQANMAQELPHFGFELLNMDTATPVDAAPQESNLVKAVLFDAPIAAAQGVYNYVKSVLYY